MSQCPKYSNLVINHYIFFSKEKSLPGQISAFGSPQNDECLRTKTDIILTKPDLGAQPGQSLGDCMNAMPSLDTAPLTASPARPPHPPYPVPPLDWRPPSLQALPLFVLTLVFQGIMKKLACNPHDFVLTAPPCVSFWLQALYGSLEKLLKSLFRPINWRVIKLRTSILDDLLSQKHFILIFKKLLRVILGEKEKKKT